MNGALKVTLVICLTAILITLIICNTFFALELRKNEQALDRAMRLMRPSIEPSEAQHFMSRLSPKALTNRR
jgi:hypothetical protein